MGVVSGPVCPCLHPAAARRLGPFWRFAGGGRLRTLDGRAGCARGWDGAGDGGGGEAGAVRCGAGAVAVAVRLLWDVVRCREVGAGAAGCRASLVCSRYAALCCAVLLSSYYLYGFNSSAFALSFVLALIVMYDATGVRWAAGLHAKAINQIVEYLDSGDVNDQEKDSSDLIPRLNESLGHRVIEVICGALLGFLIAFIAHIVRQGGLFPA